MHSALLKLALKRKINDHSASHIRRVCNDKNVLGYSDSSRCNINLNGTREGSTESVYRVSVQFKKKNRETWRQKS